MQTSISEKYKNTADGKEAYSILRSCVHCGFCTATCPTYQLLGDELDSPRGRIYLIKQVLEGQHVSRKTQQHLDRCLTCRSCETTCPSGVHYSRLLDIGRGMLEKEVPRPITEISLRWLLRKILPYTKPFTFLLRIAQAFAPLLPSALKKKIPQRKPVTQWPADTNATRTMLVLDGCVQPATSPNTNAATARVLSRLGISLVRAPQAGCCGAVSYHLSAHNEGLTAMRKNIDAWWPYIEGGAEAIVMTASGCGAMVKEYAELLAHDTIYAEKAKQVSVLCKDISEILIEEDLSTLSTNNSSEIKNVAFHSPCTLQHAQQITGTVEKIIQQAGYTLTVVVDSHLCCGSAGTYSILQPKLSQQLLTNKVSSLQNGEPDYIVTANIGCQLHIESKATVPVKHWIELLDEA
ncbi:MAG: glycolate oxidase subunit GlcF [Gammaproteobacteria bacterium]|nr:glycolate oxidase subunit GlcF [Gammaproteobacteria bacterium]